MSYNLDFIVNTMDQLAFDEVSSDQLPLHPQIHSPKNQAEDLEAYEAALTALYPLYKSMVFNRSKI